MGIPGISQALLQTAFIASAETQRATEKQKDLFIASMMLYLNTVHQLVMNSWQKFAESREDIAKDRDESHRAEQQRQVELEGAQKNAEYIKQSEEGEFVRCGIHRQAAKLCFYEGQHTIHHHLHSAV